MKMSLQPSLSKSAKSALQLQSVCETPAMRRDLAEDDDRRSGVTPLLSWSELCGSSRRESRGCARRAGWRTSW